MNIRTISGCALSCLSLLLAGAAVAQTLFTEVTDQAFAGLPVSEARGLAWGDFDNDGWPDLFLAGFNNARIALWGNQGNGRFADYTATIQLDEPPQKYGGGSIFGDYDQDGDLDLYVPTGVFQSSPTRNLLLRNERGAFVEVGLAAGLTDSLPTDNALWLDYDRDGYLDIYTGNIGAASEDPTVRDKLYRNQGNGTFVDVTQQAGLDLQLHALWGGSNGGMAAGDFNDDGWPDLYVGVYQERNRLFLNKGQGGFRDATTSEIGDPGEAFGVAVGDIDNDGDLEIFQAAGGSGRGRQRSLMLLNLGGGQFLDVTEGVGLGGLTGDTWGPGLADLDNDGDLDLVLSNPLRLFLNNGEGIFSDQTDRLGFSTVDFGLAVSWGDGDLDGFLDMAIDVGGRLRLYHNKGNPNHYLRVELVGTKSNRSGIGARLIAKAGDLQQMREILGGLGFYQDEMVAHFGLGERAEVDRLEIRWPSGQVDVLTDIPADQKIRVIEGSNRYHRIEPTRWQQAPPETLVAGTIPHLNLSVQPALFEPEARITRVTADLSALGGSTEVALVEEGDGTYHLRDFPLPITAANGVQTLHVMIDQTTSLGPYWTRLSRQVIVVPGEDLVVFDEALAQDWQVEGNSRIKRLDLSETGVVHQGRLAGAFEGEERGWRVTFTPPAPVGPVGYTALRFAFHPGEVVPPSTARFAVTLLPSKALSLLDSGWVDLNKKAWQVVEIPVGAFERVGPISSITFTGNFAGTFYLDDLRLVAATPPPVTVVEEDHTTALPHSFALSQNFPNPFNSETVIHFELPESGEVELVVYNLAGQRVAKLAEGVREAGSYTIRWDGRDGRGKELASGVYLYRLRTGAQVETRKLVLVR